MKEMSKEWSVYVLSMWEHREAKEFDQKWCWEREANIGHKEGGC